MNRGKSICKELKAVRRRIADENGIPLEIPECTYAGPCRGTCPRCEAELHYLENELAKRISVDKVATVAGLALALSAPAAVQAQEPQEKEKPSKEVRTPQAKQYPVKGCIVDGKTKEPLPFCNVVASKEGGETRGATTDFDGFFKMELPEGSYTLRITYIGYKPIELPIIVSPKNDTIDVALEATGQLLGMSETIVYGMIDRYPIIEIGPEGNINTEIEGVKVTIQY